MSSFFSHWSNFTAANALHLVVIFVVALIANRLLKVMTNVVIKPAGSQTRVAQLREQQTRTLAEILYSLTSKVVWAVALLTAVHEFGINVVPAAALAGLGTLALGFGAQNLVRDLVTGFYIILEDQYVVGDTIQTGDNIGRVERLTLRRTVLRDARGALVTIANGEIRTVSNLSRDWSQAFVDVSLSPETALDKGLQALEAAASELRGDPAWSQALVDGPRILGLQSFDPAGPTVRLQVRTVPTRQDEVSRELRRRIHLEFHKQGIPLSNVQRVELTGASLYAQGSARPEHSV